MNFLRWKPSEQATRAHREFCNHHTELNNLYWSFVPLASYGSYVARNSVEPATAKLFFANGPDVVRIPPIVSDWKNHFGDFKNWVRLGVIMSAMSYFEVYFRTAITLALLSDPLARHGAAKALDGMKLVKVGASYEIDTQVTYCVKGEWPKRLATFRRLFAKVPTIFSSENISILEEIRGIRNKVGHAFGRDIHSNWNLVGSGRSSVERLSENRLKKYLGLLFDVAADVDIFLLGNFIGEFEYLLEYHRWLSKKRTDSERRVTVERAFAKCLGGIRAKAPGINYSRELIAYYDSL